MVDIDMDELLALETDVWRALVDGDGEADGRLLSSDFVGVYPSGFADRGDHVGQLADGPTVTHFELHDARVIEVSESAALLVYRARYRRPEGPTEGDPDEMYISSLWCRRDGGWINRFSQDTPSEPAPD